MNDANNGPEFVLDRGLRDLEQNLKQIQVPASEMNLGVVMYRAGWEAALASQCPSEVSVKSNGREAVSGWWRTLAVVATLASVGMGLLLASTIQGPRGEQLAASESGLKETVADREASSVSTATSAVEAGHESNRRRAADFRSIRFSSLSRTDRGMVWGNESSLTLSGLRGSGATPVAVDAASTLSLKPPEPPLQIRSGRSVLVDW